MRKLSERQLDVLRSLADGAVLICHHTPGREHEPGAWRVEGRRNIDVLGATANGLFDRGFLRGRVAMVTIQTYTKSTMRDARPLPSSAREVSGEVASRNPLGFVGDRKFRQRRNVDHRL